MVKRITYKTSQILQVSKLRLKRYAFEHVLFLKAGNYILFYLFVEALLCLLKLSSCVLIQVSKTYHQLTQAI